MSTGVVTAITTDWRGDTLAADVLSTATVLPVSSVVDFDEDGGWLVVGDSAPKAYLTVDEDTNTVTLAAAVGAAYELGLPVNLWDPTVAEGGAQVVEYVATVELHDGTGSPDAVIPHDTIPTSGTDLLIGATVRIAEDGEWYVENVIGREAQIDGTRIDSLSISEIPEASTTEPFSGTTLPTGWTATKTGFNGTGSGAVAVPGTSVINSAVPSGMSGSALLIDMGPSGLTGTAGDAAGEVVTQLPDAADAEITVKYRCAFNATTFSTEYARLAVRRSDGPAWSGTEEAVTLELLGAPDFFGGWQFPVYITTNGADSQVGSITIETDPTAANHWARLKVSAGQISAKIWQDGTTEPDWMFSANYSGIAVGGKASLIWQQLTGFSTSRGQKLWVDELAVTNFADGFYVLPDSTGDWPYLRRRVMADVAAARPQVERGKVNSGGLVAGTPSDVSVTFDAAFDVAPVVTISLVGVANPMNFGVCAASVTKTGFTARFVRSSGTAAIDAHWSAGPST